MRSLGSILDTLRTEARHGRLAQRLIFWTVLFSGAIALLITVAQLVIEYRRDVRVVDERFALIEQGYLPSIIDSTWVADRKRLGQLLAGIARLPDFAYAEVHHDGKTIARAGHASKGGSLKKRWPLHYVYRGDRLLIGELEVGADLAAARARFVDRAWFIIGANFVKTLLVAGFLFLLVHHLVTRHLERISRYAADLSPQQLDVALALDRGPVHDDEIDRLTEAINRMRESLRRSYADLRELNESLEMRVETRTAELSREVFMRRLHEDALERNEGQLRSILDATTEGIIVADPAGRIIVFNPAAGRIFGCPPAEMIGVGINQLMPAEEARAHDDHVQRYLQTGDGSIVGSTRELKGRRRDGGEFPLLLGLSECFGRDGERLFVAVVQDLTERRHFEEELMAAKLVADQASAAKSEFLARMSHELRTPLNVIIGYSQLMSTDRTEPLAPSQRRSAEQILDGGRHLLSLINEVLDLASIEAGRLQVLMAPIDIGPMVSNCLREVEPLVMRDGITLHRPPLPESPMRVMADATRLRQVLLNLLANAIKYNRPGGDVFIELQPEGDRLRLAVRDTGVGFSDEQAKQLFQPFSRLDTKNHVEGAGIGLALTRRLMEVMGGSIDAQGRAGIGATFSVFLKMAPD